MTVKELRKALEGVDDNVEVVADFGYDHRLLTFDAAKLDSAEDTGADLIQYWDEQNMSEGSRRVDVVMLW